MPEMTHLFSSKKKRFYLWVSVKVLVFLNEKHTFLAFQLYKTLQKITLRFNNLTTSTVMNAKRLVFVICVEAIMCLSLYNLHECTVLLNVYVLHEKFPCRNQPGKLVRSFW